MTNAEVMRLKPIDRRGQYGKGRQRVVKQVRDGNGTQRVLSLLPEDVEVMKQMGEPFSKIVRASLRTLAVELGVPVFPVDDWVQIADRIGHLHELDRSKTVRWALWVMLWASAKNS